MRNLSISKEVWTQLKAIKKEHGFKHIHHAIKYLLENKDPQPFLLDDTTIDRVKEIQEKNGFSSIDETIMKIIEYLERYIPIIAKYDFSEELAELENQKSQDIARE